MNSVVSIWKDDNIYDATRQAMELIRNEIFHSLTKWGQKYGNNILIKPNLLSTPLNYLANTSVEVCLGIADFLKEIGDYNIFIGDGTTYDRHNNPSTIKALENHRYSTYREKWMLVDLNKDEVGTWFPIINFEDSGSIELGISKLATECYIISVAKFKTHDVLGLTLSLKNLMGTLIAARDEQSKKMLARGDVKGYMHGFGSKKPERLSKKQNVGLSKVALASNIIRMAHFIRPHLAIVDGSNIMEGAGPLRGNAAEGIGNIIVAGTDSVAVDTICTKLVDASIEDYPCIHLAGNLGLGTSNVEEIDCLGGSINKLRTKIKFHPLFYESSWTKKELNDLRRFSSLRS